MNCGDVMVDRYGRKFPCTRWYGHRGDHWCTGRPWHQHDGSRTYWRPSLLVCCGEPWPCAGSRVVAAGSEPNPGDKP